MTKMSKFLWERHAPQWPPPSPVPMRPRFWTPSIINFWLRHWSLIMLVVVTYARQHVETLRFQPQGRSDTVLAASPWQDRPHGILFQHRYAAAISYIHVPSWSENWKKYSRAVTWKLNTEFFSYLLFIAVNGPPLGWFVSEEIRCFMAEERSAVSLE